MLFGIDVSYHQGLIDWPKVRTSGVRFAIIKASEGEGYTDPMFEQNMLSAAEAEIVAGTYHFFLPRYDPLAQARHYVKTLQELGGGKPTLPPCVDIETPGPGKSAYNQSLKVFLEEIFRLTGRTAMITSHPASGTATCRYPFIPATSCCVPVWTGRRNTRCGWHITPPAGRTRCTPGLAGHSGSTPVRARSRASPPALTSTCLAARRKNWPRWWNYEQQRAAPVRAHLPTAHP